MHLDVRETVNVVLRTWPGASHVLRRHGLDDFLWWGGTPLDEACRAQGIEVAAVVAEIVRQADPDVAHAFRAKPGGQTAPAPAPAAAGPPSGPERARAEIGPEEGLPDVAQAFHARAGTPTHPFQRAHRPQPEPAPAPPEEPEATAPAAPPPTTTPRPTPPPAEPAAPDRAALIARRKELQDELAQLKALRDRTRKSDRPD